MLEGRCTRGEIGKGFIILKPHFTPSEALEFEIQNFIKSYLSMHEFPREIEFINALLETPDGKVQRKELKKTERSL
jgi:acetyl-CoA synthetase